MDQHCANCYGMIHVKVIVPHEEVEFVEPVEVYAIWYIQGQLEWFEKLHKGVLFDSANAEVKT